jgi:hypothetical protein
MLDSKKSILETFRYWGSSRREGPPGAASGLAGKSRRRTAEHPPLRSWPSSAHRAISERYIDPASPERNSNNHDAWHNTRRRLRALGCRAATREQDFRHLREMPG